MNGIRNAGVGPRRILLAALIMVAGLSAPAASAQGFSVVDALGRTVSFPAVPQRIVVANKAVFMLADALYLFSEAPSRIIAMSRTAQGKLDFSPVIDPSHGEKTILESQVGPEQIAAVSPDLVILKSSIAQTQGKAIEALGVPVVYLSLETPEQYAREILTLGRILDDEARARALAAAYAVRTDRVAKALDGLSEEAKPRVLMLYYAEQGGGVSFSVPPMGWIQTMLVRMAGGRPAWKDAQLGQGWTKVSIEQIAAWDPDQVYLIAYSTDAGAVVKRLAADPQWRGLRAVKRGMLRGFPMDYYSWDQPDARWILGLTWLAARVNPDRFPGMDMLAETRSFYRDFYGMGDAVFHASVQPLLSGVLP
jgi:iron complex transport system substrate-binding protein